MDTGWGIRLQIFVAILTGILVIVITTAVVIGMGRSPSNADGLDKASDPFPTLAFPTPVPSPTPALTSSPTPEASPSKKPSVKPPSPTPPANKLTLSCGFATVPIGADIDCTVEIEPAAASNLTIAIDASTEFVQVPPTVSIASGQYFSSAFIVHGNALGGPTPITAKVGGLQAQFMVTVIPAT